MEIGDMAPDLLGLDHDGREVRLSEYAGRKVALCFYPKDNTSGCTAEACSLRDNYEALREAGYEIIGVSVDGQKSHRNFIEKHALPFRLVADTEKQLVETFGVWAEKSMYGRKYMGTLRTTFIIGTDGRIAGIIGPKQIKTKTHGEQLLQLSR
ncbi:peroxiredoxin Bcp [Bacteroidaceae bacterium]|uniref:peroxiredoxin n=1 Tax=Prevotella sp. MGM2 TaxID=2033406 RepID=UPI000CEA1183|nr:peroxiredoxin [Prevotella sp. MGM2]GFI35075.1 peroxiredoxin Bcp [Bacteroidaceae bacterium]